jgi:hypothetical protein
MDVISQRVEQSGLEQQVELLGSRDYRVVGRAWEVLKEAGEAGMAAVIRGLAHPWARVRRGCAEFMDHHGTGSCVDALLRIARTDPIPYVRRVAVHSLGCQRCKVMPLRLDLVAFLVERAAADDNIRVRREAVSGLSLQPPDPRAAEALRTILGAQTDRELRRLAHHALKHHDPEYRREAAEKAKARALAASSAE